MNNNPYAAAYHNIRAIEQQKQERAAKENMPPRQVTMQFILALTDENTTKLAMR